MYEYAGHGALVPLAFTDYASADASPESGKHYTVFTDPVGQPLQIEDAKGQLVWFASRVDPYGHIEVHPASQLEYNLRWPGHYYDPETALHYNRYRYYDPGLGRYLQTDPLGYEGSPTNLYGYPANPLTDVDVLGLTHPAHPSHADGGDSPHPHDGTESPPRRMTIAEREAAGGRIPDYAQENPHLYYFDTESSTYRRIEGEGHSRTSEFPTGYRDSTHEGMVAAHTREGQAQGTGRPVDAAGNPIPREDLTWLAPPDSTGHRAEYPPGTDITYDHNTSCVSMWNNGAVVTNPDGTTTAYPPGRSSSRETRTNFYNDTSNLVPMPRSENSSKGGGGGTYNSLPTTSTYEH